MALLGGGRAGGSAARARRPRRRLADPAISGLLASVSPGTRFCAARPRLAAAAARSGARGVLGAGAHRTEAARGDPRGAAMGRSPGSLHVGALLPGDQGPQGAPLGQLSVDRGGRSPGPTPAGPSGARRCRGHVARSAWRSTDDGAAPGGRGGWVNGGTAGGRRPRRATSRSSVARRRVCPNKTWLSPAGTTGARAGALVGRDSATHGSSGGPATEAEPCPASMDLSCAARRPAWLWVTSAAVAGPVSGTAAPGRACTLAGSAPTFREFCRFPATGVLHRRRCADQWRPAQTGAAHRSLGRPRLDPHGQRAAGLRARRAGRRVLHGRPGLHGRRLQATGRGPVRRSPPQLAPVDRPAGRIPHQPISRRGCGPAGGGWSRSEWCT